MKKWLFPISENHGFSMVGLMVVLVIIGILVLLALPKLEPVVTKAKASDFISLCSFSV
jgi:prepilin-type N-terminal cleavage/methylation domain-containing protein